MRTNVKKVLLVGILGLGVLALAQELPGYTRKFSESQLATETAPTNPTSADGGVPTRANCTDTEGMLLDSVHSYRVSVCGPANSVLDGGSLEMWVLDQDRCKWMRAPVADETISVSGKQCQQFPDRLTGVSVGRMLPNCLTVGFWNADGGGQVNDGGLNCDVQVKGYLRRGTVP